MRPSPTPAAMFRLAAALAVRGAQQTAYQIFQGAMGFWNSTNKKRKVLEGWNPPSGSAIQEVLADLPELIKQGRHLDRTAPVFRGLVEGRKAELVGTGIAVEWDTGDKGLDKELGKAWQEELEYIGVCEESLWTLQRQACGEIDVAGSVLWRGLVLPERVKQGRIPWCILALEVEWLAEQAAPEGVAGSNQLVRGVEIDQLGRAVAVHLRNPDDQFAPAQRIRIEEVALAFERRRPRAVLGAPRLGTLIERTLQDDELVISELKAARNGSGIAAVVNDDALAAIMNGTDTDGSTRPPEQIDVGSVAFLPTNAKFNTATMNRPSASVKDFRGTLRGDMAAGGQVSRVWLDRDGQAYNFSNSKFDAIRTQMMVKPAHDWFGRAVASWPAMQALPWLMLKLGRKMPTDPVALRKLRNHRLLPDVPPELDEGAAAKGFAEGYRQRITTRAEFISSHGKDPAQIAADRDAEELDDAQRAIARLAKIQKLCDQANATNPNLGLHWSKVANVPTAEPVDLLAAPAAPPQNGATNA